MPSLTHGCETWTLNDQIINRVNVAWNNSFRHIFFGFWRETVKPLQYFCQTLPISYFIDQSKLLGSGENWPCITITFCYLFHGSCKTGFMQLAACMVSLPFLLQLVKLSRPFGLSLQRLCGSLVMFVYVSIFSFSLLSFIDMSACSVFYRNLLILYFICILCSYSAYLAY